MQGSTWVLQGRRLNGKIGMLTVLPEQIQIMNPLLILLFVPICEGLVYPCVRKVTAFLFALLFKTLWNFFSEAALQKI